MTLPATSFPGGPSGADAGLPPAAHPIVTTLQLDLLRVIWAHGPCSVDFVRDAVAARHKLARATIHTLLRRLARRGILEIQSLGRAHRYAARVTEAQVREAMVRTLVDSVFTGRPSAVVAHVLADPGLDATELASLRALIEDRKAG